MKVTKKNFLIPIIILPIIILITIFALLFFAPHKLSDLEQISFEEKTANIVNFLEVFDASSTEDQQDKQDSELSDEEITKLETQAQEIDFAAQLLFTESKDSTFSTDSIIKTVNSHIDNPLQKEDFKNNNLGIFLYGHSVDCQPDADICSYANPYSTKKEAAASPIKKYILKKVSRKGDTYTAVYTRYTIENPYRALNVTSLEDYEGKHSVNDYLEGNGTQLAIKERINSGNIEKITEPDGEIEVEYKLKDGNILFKRIK